MMSPTLREIESECGTSAYKLPTGDHPSWVQRHGAPERHQSIRIPIQMDARQMIPRGLTCAPSTNRFGPAADRSARSRVAPHTIMDRYCMRRWCNARASISTSTGICFTESLYIPQERYTVINVAQQQITLGAQTCRSLARHSPPKSLGRMCRVD